ncbi:MAG TPA: tRNA uridine-5-carboxymethylaminomethyl(34) synthesis GTPase MnmE [Deltaproteobacteria bacterium]|nr:tRNA uridine-5-carboxymethylaminomethyl(34) synthesis GTPase MnmE [Deltaproteobacteria bacterium]
MLVADTISALSSARGEGGIGVLRMTGPQSHRILRSLFRPHKERPNFASHHLYLGFIVDPDTGSEIDEVFVVFMEEPHTYTREKMVEVYSHGGFAPQKKILSLMIQQGARAAEPGEFTKRAFLNGRIDLAQAESVLDVVKSETDQELDYALQQLKGLFSAKIETIRETLQSELAEKEAQLDFPDEELDLSEVGGGESLEGVRKPLAELIASYEEGRIAVSGLRVLIVGRTNVGKSSLLNALLLEERAIVTPLPGTTRDLIEDTIHIKGMKVRIVDTAGFRTPSDIIEQEGIDRVRRKIPWADIVLWVLDNDDCYSADDEEVWEAIKDKQVLVVVNKADLPARLQRDALIQKGLPWVEVCALHGSGLDALKERLYQVFLSRGYQGGGRMLVTNIRHRDALVKADAAIERAITCMNGGDSLEFVAFELREALSHLGEITGETCTEEILDQIFSRFCIGK